MLSVPLVTAVWHVFRLQMEETVYRCGLQLQIPCLPKYNMTPPTFTTFNLQYNINIHIS
jgi:hypothetical protein